MNSNRRNFYRIKNKAYIQYNLSSGSDDVNEGAYCRHPAYLELMNELHNLDLEANRLLAHIPERERTSAALFRIINKKIEMIARTLTLSEADIPEQEYQTIDISEGGIAFYTEESLPPGQMLIIKLILIPDYFSIMGKAEVVECQAAAPKVKQNSLAYWTRANFIDLESRQRQLLTQHILKLQQEERRQQVNEKL